MTATTYPKRGYRANPALRNVMISRFLTGSTTLKCILSYPKRVIAMCGRFAQFQTTAQYLEQLSSDLEFVGGYDSEPLAHYNIGPGTRVLMLNQRDNTLHLDAVR